MGRVYDFTKKKFVEDDEDRYEVKKRDDGTLSIVRNARSASPRLADQWRSDPTMAEAKSAIKSGNVAEFNSAQVRMKRPTLPTVFPAKKAAAEPVRPVVKREGLMLPTAFVSQGRAAVPKQRAEQRAKEPGLAWAQGAPTAPARPVQKGQGLLAKYFPSPYDQKREQAAAAAAASGTEQKGQGLLGQYIKPPHVREAEQREAMEQIKAGVRFEDLLGKQAPLTNMEKIIANNFIKEREKQYRAKLAASMAQLQPVSEEDQAFSMQTSALKDRISGTGAFVKGGVNALSLGGLDRAGRKQDEAARALSEMVKSPATQAAKQVADSHNGKSVAQIAKEENPLAYGVGSFAGETAKYLAYAPLIEGIPLVGKAAQSVGAAIAKLTGGRLGAQVATNLVSGRIVDLPFDVINAIQNTDNPGDFVKSVAGDQALGLLTDGAVEGIVFGWKQIKAALKDGQLRKIMDADAIKDADIDAYLEKQHGGDARRASTFKPLSYDYEKVAMMEPVSKISGKEFQKSEINLPDQVSAYFESLGGVVHNARLGEIEINRRGIKDSMAHGIGSKKSAAFAAVPEVLTKGEIIDYQPNWKNRGYETYVIAAPVDVAGERNYVGAIVIKEGENRFYLHEVLTAKGGNEPFKTGRGKTASEPGGSSPPSLVSLIRQLQDVNPPERKMPDMDAYAQANKNKDGASVIHAIKPATVTSETVLASNPSFSVAQGGAKINGENAAFDAVSAPLRVAEEAQAKMQGQSLPTEFGAKTQAQGLPTEFGQKAPGASIMDDVEAGIQERLTPYRDAMQTIDSPERFAQYRTSTLKTLEDLNALHETAVGTYAEYIHGYKGNGFSLLPMFDASNGDIVGSQRISNNEAWYNRYAGKPLNWEKSLELARKVVDSPRMQADFPNVFDKIEEVNALGDLRGDLSLVKEYLLDVPGMPNWMPDNMPEVAKAVPEAIPPVEQPPLPNAAQLRQAYADSDGAMARAEIFVRTSGITPNEMELAKMVSEGKLLPEQLTEDQKRVVLEYAERLSETSRANRPIEMHREMKAKQTEEQMRELIAGSDQWKDKKAGLWYE